VPQVECVLLLCTLGDEGILETVGNHKERQPEVSWVWEMRRE